MSSPAHVASSSVERQYIALVELARGLVVASDWSQFAEWVGSSLGSGQHPSTRVWAMVEDGVQELARCPGNSTLPVRDIRMLRRALRSGEPIETGDGHYLIGLHSRGAPVGVLEIGVESVDADLIWHAAPLISLAAASLALGGVGGTLLNGSGGALSGIDSVIGTFAAQAKLLLDHDRLSAYLITPDGRAVERFAVATSPVLPGEGVIVPFSEFGLRHVLQTNQALLSDDLAEDSRIVGREDRTIAQAGFHGLLSVPLRLGGQPFGVLNFVSHTRGFYREQDIELGQQVADQAAAFFENLRRQRDVRMWTIHAAAERERARLGRELHDTLLRCLPTISRGAREIFEQVKTSAPSLSQAARNLVDDADAALVETQRALVNLLPPKLESHSLEEVIERELALLEEVQQIDTVLVSRGDTRPLTLAVRRAVYRCLQEALSNIRHHTTAGRVEVTLNVGRDLTMTIVDDGGGFDPETAQSGSGLGVRFMRERAQSLGGRLLIDSAIGHGTTLTLELPDVRDAVDFEPPADPDLPAALNGVSLRVFVVEPHPLLLAGITHALEQRGDVRLIGRAATAAEAHSSIARLCPDVVLLDVDADEGQAHELMRRLKRIRPSTVIIGMSDTQAPASELDELGASGVISKELPPSELLQVIVAIASGNEAPGLVTPRSTRMNRRPHLTARERAILALVAAGRTNAEIGETLFLAPKTIERYVTNVVSKIGAHNRAHAAAIAVARGLVRLELPD